MEKNEISEIECMLVVIFKRLEDVEKAVKGGSRLASYSSYFKELKNEARKVKESIEASNRN